MPVSDANAGSRSSAFPSPSTRTWCVWRTWPAPCSWHRQRPAGAVGPQSANLAPYSSSATVTKEIDESAFGVTHGLPEDPWEPTTGANTLRFTSTDPDPAGPSLQMKGSPFDSLRPRQTPDSCLGSRGRRIKSGRPYQKVQVRRGTGVLAETPLRPSGANGSHLMRVNADRQRLLSHALICPT
jgi:hypothetical protein